MKLMTRLNALVALAFFLLAPGAVIAAMAQTGIPEITESDVVACTRVDAAMAFIDAMRKNDKAQMGRYLANEVCSRFASISYRPIRIIGMDTEENPPHIVHAKVFHLMDLYVITDRPVPGGMER